jgi:O-antigen/teichoic acid export membrane protein
MVLLGVRSALQNLVILVANVFLARWLDPRDYGLFAILQFALSFFRLISDTGFGAALVQQKNAPDDTELSTIWWLQLAIGFVLAGVSLAVAPFLPWVWSTMPHEAAWLLPALALGLLFTMLQSVPFLVLERDVRFGWVGTLEFAGTTTFYGTALVLAARHAGPMALVAASVGQSALVAALAHFVQPWRPKLRFRFASVRRLFKFGAAFQAGNAVAFANAAVTPLLVGARLGSEALGLVQFAETTAFFPSVVVGLVRRVYFPFLCRLQSDKEAFRREFEQAVVLCAAPTFFFFGLFAGAAPAVISIIYGAKWLPAVPALVVLSLGFGFSFFSWIADAVMAALDDMGRLFRIKVIAVLVNWTATLAAVAWRPTTFAFALGFCVQLIVTPFLMLAAVRKLVPGVKVFAKLRGLAVASLAVVALGRTVLEHVDGVAKLAMFVIVALFVFTAVAMAADADLRRAARAFLASWNEKKDRGVAPQAADG